MIWEHSHTNCAKQAKNFSCSHVFPAGVNQVMLCLLVSSLVPSTSVSFSQFPWWSFYTFLYFLVVIPLIQMAPRDHAEVLPKVTSTRRLWCPLEEGIGLAKMFNFFYTILEKNPNKFMVNPYMCYVNFNQIWVMLLALNSKLMSQKHILNKLSHKTMLRVD